jgi:hypothetical protein
MAIQVSDRPLGEMMQLVASRYARLTQRGIPTTGHFFERRYRASLVDRDEYLLALTRYIHLNPVRAGIARSANEYRWSSHLAYLGSGSPAWLTTKLITRLFGAHVGAARHNYRRFMAIEPGDEEVDRVRNGWPEDASRTAQASRTCVRSSTGPPRSRRSLDEIINSELARRGISFADLTGPGKHRILSAARAEIARQALNEGVATLSELASKFNRSLPALSRLIRTSRRRSSAS